MPDMSVLWSDSIKLLKGLSYSTFRVHIFQESTPWNFNDLFKSLAEPFLDILSQFWLRFINTMQSSINRRST